MKKLALVGSHSDTRGNAPFDNLDYDIWVYNEAAQASWCKRWDAVFQLHAPAVYTNPDNPNNREHWAWLQKPHPGKTIWMQDRDERVPASRRYPLDEIIDTIPAARVYWESHSQPWFDSSAAYALALALYLGYEEIHVYGMDLTSNTEYTYQLGNWRYWVGAAAGAGVRVILHCSYNDFGTGRLYGYEGEIQIEREFFARRVNDLEPMFHDAERHMLRQIERLSQRLLEHRYDRIAELAGEVRNASLRCGELAGALGEAEFFARRADPVSRQEYEKRSAAAQHQAEELRARMYHEGGKIEYVWNVLKTTGAYEALRQLRDFLRIQQQLAYDTGAHYGIMRENQLYMQEYDTRLTAAGGIKTLAALGG